MKKSCVCSSNLSFWTQMNFLKFEFRISKLLRVSARPGQTLGKPGAINELGSCFHGKPWIPCQARNDR
jgi:hypothetical protein